MTATDVLQPLRLDSPVEQARRLGGRMGSTQVLDVIERLLLAARHPDVVDVERYGPGDGPWGPSVQESKAKHITGLMVRYQSTATASLWEAVWPGEEPVDPPQVLPVPRQNRAPRLLIFTAQLLDAAKPEQFKAWRLVTLPKLGNPDTQTGLPFGLSIVTADGQRVLLRATATGPTVGVEPDEEPFPDYVIPEGVKTCLRGSSTAKTGPCPPVGAASASRS